MNDYLPLITGFIGALIGGAASIITIYIQIKSNDKRQRIKLVADLAIQDHKSMLDLASKTNRQVNLPPLIVYIHYHSELIKALDEGDLSTERIQKIKQDNETVINIIPQ